MIRPRRWRDGLQPGHRETLALWMAAGLLLLAWLNPGWTGRRQVLDLVAVLDITQSMDVADMNVGDDPTPVSRLTRSRQLLLQALPTLPCGSRVGLAIFSEYRSLLLLAPVEVCDNYRDLKQTLASIDGRMAWTGNSEIAKGLYNALEAAKSLPSLPAVVFFTDGQESPPIDARYRPHYKGQPGDVHGLLVGVGGDQPLPIPRHDPSGQPIGTWGVNDVPQNDPRSAGRTGSSVGNEAMADSGAALPPLPGATPGREHLSALREAYLQLLARELKLGFHRLNGLDGLSAALRAPELTHEVDSRVSLRVPAALLALLLLLAVYAAPLWPAVRRRWPHR
jgi:mxaL protein